MENKAEKQDARKIEEEAEAPNFGHRTAPNS